MRLSTPKDIEGSFKSFDRKMRREGLPDAVIRSFRFYYGQLAAGATGLISEAEIEPVASLPGSEELGQPEFEFGSQVRSRTVILKLNGGLGTSMGLERAKSLLWAKQNLTFLDIIARQALQWDVPLVLMNSFSTREDSMRLLGRYPTLDRGLPLDFLQHKIPRIRQSDLAPVLFPSNQELEWCPPGHGDLFTALQTTGMLARLLDRGLRYAFVSNADNLGAFLDERILGYFAGRKIPFLMEVAERTGADRKGGHLAREQGGGRFILRESAQCPEEEMEAFQDISRHRFFNTNNLWIDLGALQAMMDRTSGFLQLPLIRNSKTVDPQDLESEAVFQLETAMGAAIQLFDGAAALRVPRTRFAPVKTCEDLLIVRSDATSLDDRFRLLPSAERGKPLPLVRLDPSFFRNIADLERRFAEGVPSLVRCERLEVKGDIFFGRGVRLEGSVELINNSGRAVRIPPGSVLTGRPDVGRWLEENSVFSS